MATYKTCDGFHGVSRITLDDSRILRVGDGEFVPKGDAAWLTPKEMKDNRPCGIRNCTCCDNFTILEVMDGGYGDCLVALFGAIEF